MHTPHQLVVSGWYGVLLQRRKLQLVLHAATMPKLSTEHHRSAITETITSRTFLSVCYSPGGVNKKAQLKSEDFLLHTPPPLSCHLTPSFPLLPVLGTGQAGGGGEEGVLVPGDPGSGSRKTENCLRVSAQGFPCISYGSLHSRSECCRVESRVLRTCSYRGPCDKKGAYPCNSYVMLGTEYYAGQFLIT